MRVFIAGPYAGGDPVLNTQAAVRAAEAVVALGHTPFVPHLSHLWHLVSPHEVDYWLRLDMAWLEACDCLVRLPGESPGADGEVRRAKDLGLPVYTLEEWLGVAV